jgi:DNA-binding MarR family transcriptional regulator
MSQSHTSEFLEIGVTMPQAKTLHLVATEGRIRMSTLAARLGVTLSTVSGLVERLVEAGCVSRHDDPSDRRQVVVSLTPEGEALIERFRDLNRRQLRGLLDLMADDDLSAMEQSVIALTRAAEQQAAEHRASEQATPRRSMDASPPTPAPSGATSSDLEREPS